MPATLLHVGGRKPPGSARRRIAWMIVILVPFGAITGLFAFSTVRNWIARAQGEAPVPGFGDTVWLTVITVVMLVLLVLWSVVGIARVREQRTAEDGRASMNEGISAAARR